MVKVQIGSAVVLVNKNEVKEISRIGSFVQLDRDYAQRSADVWMRSAANNGASGRRKAAVRALGLSDEIKFL